MEVEVGENERHGGDDYCYDVALGFEEICEHGDEKQYAEQDGEEALPVRKREADKARQHLEGAAAVGYEHGHKRVLAAEIAEADLALAEQEARKEETRHAEDNLQKAGNSQHFCSASHAFAPLTAHFRFLKHTGAVRAAGGGNGDLALAVGALLRGRGGGGGGLFADAEQLVHALEQEEEYERGDEKVQYGAAEVAGKLGDVRAGVLRRAGDGADDGVDEIVRQRGDDAGEGAAYQHADGHVHDVAAQGEGLEFIKQFFHILCPSITQRPCRRIS